MAKTCKASPYSTPAKLATLVDFVTGLKMQESKVHVNIVHISINLSNRVPHLLIK
jgi:hypothetical protein